jgi:hypothetical protein
MLTGGHPHTLRAAGRCRQPNTRNTHAPAEVLGGVARREQRAEHAAQLVRTQAHSALLLGRSGGGAWWRGRG